MNFDLTSQQLSCINTALRYYVWTLDSCYRKVVNDPSRSDYVQALSERIKLYRDVYKLLNDGAEIIDF